MVGQPTSFAPSVLDSGGPQGGPICKPLRGTTTEPKAAYESVHVALGWPDILGFGRLDFTLPMAETRSSLTDQPSAKDLIKFLKASRKAATALGSVTSSRSYCW